MLSAASTARRAVSTVWVCSATARILESTYSASLMMYSASEPRRLYAWSKISTRTALLLGSFSGGCLVTDAITSLLQDALTGFLAGRRLLLGNGFNLLQHLLHAPADIFLLLAQPDHLA